MNYIVLDLEWNQSAKGKEHSLEDMPFEIIQIGAVKVNSQFQIVDEYAEIVRPSVYMQLHAKVKDILKISISDLMNGRDFVPVMEDFLKWCGSDYIFCTWGSMDLMELQRNMKHYHMDNTFPMPFLYYDLQKLYSICYSDGKKRITLQSAIEQMQIPENGGYHTAVNDARYTASVLMQMNFEAVKHFYSIDTFRIPANRKDEIHMNFGNYEKYISRGFTNREVAVTDREVRSCKCFLCGKSMKRNIKWFATNGKTYYGLFTCEEHGLIKGRFKSKQNDNGKYYTIRIMKLTDENGAEKIKLRQKREREHRKIRRQAK